MYSQSLTSPRGSNGYIGMYNSMYNISLHLDTASDIQVYITTPKHVWVQYLTAPERSNKHTGV